MRRLALILLCGLAAACSKPEPAAPAASAAPPPAEATAPPATHSGVAGRVQAHGAAVIVLEPTTARTFLPPQETPVMDQAGLTFGPELLLVRTGYPVEFRNSDDTLHNVRVSHEETRASAFNVAIPTGESYTYTFERDGFYRVGCDIHPAMAASVFAASSPFTTVADADGRFSFDEVPPGTWTVTAYADGKQRHKQIIVGGGVITVTIE